VAVAVHHFNLVTVGKVEGIPVPHISVCAKVVGWEKLDVGISITWDQICEGISDGKRY
jgi:hypothetical protein